MPNDVKVPLLGNVPKGGLFAGGLAVVGVAGYLWYKHQKNQAIAAKPATPASAYGYGAAATAYGYAGAMAGYGYGYGAYGYGFGQYGAIGGSPYPIGPTQPYGYGIAAPQNNAQWTQNATTALTNQGYDAPTVLTALGAYISGKPVQQGSSEDTTIQAAIALEGYPPQPGAGGYPPAINYSGKSGQGGGQATVPNVTGFDANTAAEKLKAAGFTYASNLSSPGRKGYWRRVVSQNPAGDSKAPKGSYVHVFWRYEKM